jgi:hypothetical protein
MADLQTDGARVLSLWRNEGISSSRKRPRAPGQLAKLMIDINSGEDREAAPTSAKPLPPSRPKRSAALKSRRKTTKRSRRSAGQE